MHKIKTLFLSRNISMIRRLAQWHDWPRLRALLHTEAQSSLIFLISHDRNSVLILCIIVVVVFLSRVVLYIGDGGSLHAVSRGCDHWVCLEVIWVTCEHRWERILFNQLVEPGHELTAPCPIFFSWDLLQSDKRHKKETLYTCVTMKKKKERKQWVVEQTWRIVATERSHRRRSLTGTTAGSRGEPAPVTALSLLPATAGVLSLLADAFSFFARAVSFPAGPFSLLVGGLSLLAAALSLPAGDLSLLEVPFSLPTGGLSLLAVVAGTLSFPFSGLAAPLPFPLPPAPAAVTAVTAPATLPLSTSALASFSSGVPRWNSR